MVLLCRMSVDSSVTVTSEIAIQLEDSIENLVEQLPENNADVEASDVVARFLGHC